MNQEKSYVFPFLNANGIPINVDLRNIQGVAESEVDPECALLDFGGVTVSVQATPKEVQKMAKKVGLQVRVIEKPKPSNVPGAGAEPPELPAGAVAGSEDLNSPPGTEPPEVPGIDFP